MIRLIQDDLFFNFLFNISIYPISCFLWRVKLVLEIYSLKLWPITLILRLLLIAIIPTWIILGKPIFIDNEYYRYGVPSFYQDLAGIYEFIRSMMILFLASIAWIKERKYEESIGHCAIILEPFNSRLELWHLLWWRSYDNKRENQDN